jgi:hypothetical protein
MCSLYHVKLNYFNKYCTLQCCPTKGGQTEETHEYLVLTRKQYAEKAAISDSCSDYNFYFSWPASAISWYKQYSTGDD